MRAHWSSTRLEKDPTDRAIPVPSSGAVFHHDKLSAQLSAMLISSESENCF